MHHKSRSRLKKIGQKVDETTKYRTFNKLPREKKYRLGKFFFLNFRQSGPLRGALKRESRCDKNKTGAGAADKKPRRQLQGYQGYVGSDSDRRKFEWQKAHRDDPGGFFTALGHWLTPQ
jgi:hypothetical protein